MKTTIIAEIGLNHNGNMEMAKCLIDEAHRAGADIAKFQFFDISEYFGPEFEWYEECMKARIDYDKAEMLRDHCNKVGIEFMSSVFNLPFSVLGHLSNKPSFSIAAANFLFENLSPS